MQEKVFMEDYYGEEINLRELFQKYLRNWKWFLIGVILCVAASVIYLEFTIPTYMTEASILIKDDKNGGAVSELSALQDLGVLNSFGGNSVDNELEILRSRRLFKKVVSELGINVSYYRDNNFRLKEVYSTMPFFVKILTYNQLAEMPEEPLSFSLIDNENIRIESGDRVEHYKMGSTITLPFGEIVVIPNLEINRQLLENPKAEYQLFFYQIDDVATNLLENGIQVSLSSRNSTVINLALEYPVKQKAQDILDELVNQYNKDAIKDNNMIAKNTAEFIDDRLRIIAEELDSVETDKVEFKSNNKITDITSEAQLFLENANEVSKRNLEMATQLEVINTMIDYLKQGDNSKLLPANLGPESEGLAALISTYNTLVIERGHLRENSTEKNPVVRNIDSQISQLRQTVLKSFETQRTALEIALQDMRNRELQMDNRIAGVPDKEKEFRGIERQQNIKEALYLFLLQKREEASISMAITAPKAKIVDYANSSKDPVAPKTNYVLAGGLIMGLLIPFLILFMKDLLNNKVQTRKDIEKNLPGLPIVGELPHLEEKERSLISPYDRSIFAEAFRIMRTNLQYLYLEHQKGMAKTILVTSSTKGEGKSLTASNLAISLTGTGKKVVIVGADLRNPQLSRYFEHDRNQTGLSNYLYQEGLSVADITISTPDNSSLDLITSGRIPPNPAELLLSKRADTLFSILKKQYDYIILDTAPLLLVTDTFLISKYADVILYIIRSGYSELRFTDFIQDAIKAKKLNKVALVLNDLNMADFGYGNKYGYGYSEEEKPGFVEKLKRRLSA
ncbi:GumC family protein [Robertkochia aurantiaca]|uniref:GumC family protein n=1 Tax=Robertkochia aurantiaca TaxID=2873700 RepID=UPI001CCDCEF4|nr:polysaccharide biosynthesis tyrosine autokinase [Robertkochia sp. 3YJGBD-33]